MLVGLGGSRFRPTLPMLWEIITHPYWARAMLKNGQPRFASLKSYAGANASLNDVIRFAQRELGGVFSWQEVARYRDHWKKPLIVKGILHPADAEKALSIGVDGIVVSNHGGRQIDALPAAIDCLPAVVKVVGERATVLMDSGIRSGSDVVRALALGASAAFAGKAFLWGLCALGAEGPDHVINLLTEETRSTFAQLGVSGPDEARTVHVRHLGAIAMGS
jgi:L-lactate dehydrogenase (cytochrome)